MYKRDEIMSGQDIQGAANSFINVQNSITVVGVLILALAYMMYQNYKASKKHDEEKKRRHEEQQKHEDLLGSKLADGIIENQKTMKLIAEQITISNAIMKEQQDASKELRKQLIEVLSSQTQSFMALEKKLDFHLVKLENLHICKTQGM